MFWWFFNYYTDLCGDVSQYVTWTDVGHGTMDWLFPLLRDLTLGRLFDYQMCWQQAGFAKSLSDLGILRISQNHNFSSHGFASNFFSWPWSNVHFIIFQSSAVDSRVCWMYPSQIITSVWRAYGPHPSVEWCYWHQRYPLGTTDPPPPLTGDTTAIQKHWVDSPRFFFARFIRSHTSRDTL